MPRNYVKKGPPKVTPLKKQSIIALAKAGIEKKKIAAEFGISREWLYRILREHAPETIRPKQ